jgi:hypothetical protein
MNPTEEATMTDEERADLALAVGRRVRTGWGWMLDSFAGKPVAVCYPDEAGLVSHRVYDPTVPGEDSAEALRWLWERCDSVSFSRFPECPEKACRAKAMGSTAGDYRYGWGATPEEAVARIIAAWPEEG